VPPGLPGIGPAIHPETPPTHLVCHHGGPGCIRSWLA
jgi:hypothetical protein